MRTVVIDDDQGVRRALARLLHATGHSVRTFGTAEEFLAGGTMAEVDCLIVDIYLGDMSGFDLYQALGAAGPTPPTVFITAHDEGVVAAGISRTGGTACLHKPFEEESLLETIAAAVAAAGR